MNGDKALWQMRRAQQWPAAVWILDGESAGVEKEWSLHRNCKTGELHAEIVIDENDVPEVLDFRCLVGLIVHVSATRGEDRARRLHHAVIEAKAAKVITSIHVAPWVVGEILTHGVLNG